MAPLGRVPRWLLPLILLATAFSGCLASEEPTSTGAKEPPAPPEGPGWARVVESHAVTDEAQLFGFPLDLDADDWKVSDLFAETRIALAPYGNVTGWAIFLFVDGELAWELIDLPFAVVDHETGEKVHHEGAQQPRITWIFSEQPVEYDAVVVLFGAGGLALAPDPEWPLDSPPDHRELLARPARQPAIIGTGTGMAFDAYMDFTRDLSEGRRIIFGEPQVTYEGPLPTDGASPLLDLHVVAPASLVGWASTVGMYGSNHAQGTWEATIENDATHSFGGLVVQQGLNPTTETAGELVFGRPLFLGHGATGSATVTEFRVNAASVDTREFFGLQQASFGVALGRLIGIEAPDFATMAFDGLVVPPREPGAWGQGADLVVDSGGHRSVLMGVMGPA